MNLKPHFVMILAATFFMTTIASSESVRADGEGQKEYDQAIVAKLKAKTTKDFDEVIDLCESAIKKGLDDETKKLAEELIKSTLKPGLCSAVR